MTLLHEVLAAEKGIKSRVTRDITALHRDAERAPGYAGMSRTYHPNTDGGDPLPEESTRVQLHARDVLKQLSELLTPLFDVTAQKDYTNQRATADVMVDGKVLLPDVPVSTLLFLEKQVNDIDTVIRKMPTLDPSVEWVWSPERECYVSDVIKTNRTLKTAIPVVRQPATDQHPAQVQLIHEDKVVGQFHATKFSGALSVKDHNALLARVNNLKIELKNARQRANGQKAETPSVAPAIFDYLLSR